MKLSTENLISKKRKQKRSKKVKKIIVKENNTMQIHLVNQKNEQGEQK